MNHLSVAKYDFETANNVIRNQGYFCLHFSFILINALIDEKQALLSKLSGKCSYLFAPDSTNSIEMNEQDVTAKPKN